MNKKYVNYVLVVISLTTNNISFSMGAKLVRYIAGSALVGGGSYAIDREITKYTENAWEDAPQNVQQWARKNLIEKGYSSFKNGSWLVYGKIFYSN
jgi:hypothetical protein